MFVSVVIPLLNEEGNLEVLKLQLEEVLQKETPNYELIFIDDGSTDASLEIIRRFSQADKRIKGISFSRNFGHQIALTAGLQHAKGDIVISMDADLQHPPKVIHELIATYKQGFDIVNTIRKETADASLFKKATSKGFYNLMNRLSDVKIEPAAADFRLMSRATVDAFLKLPEKDRFTRGLISWMGFKQAMIPYAAPERFAGTSKYSLKKMVRFAADGITSFSARPLRVSFYMGLIISLIALIYAVFALIQYFKGNTQPGWTSILLSVLFIGGIQLISIGIIGEYLARVFNEAKNRPLYLIKEYIQQENE
jgi:glycosyltransferase involved in cell wall biosynthesis